MLGLGAVGGLLGRLLGSPRAIGAVASAARDGFDALVYTDQEKAREDAAERASARQHLIDWMRASQGQNVARRILAFMVGGCGVPLGSLQTSPASSPCGSQSRCGG